MDLEKEEIFLLILHNLQLLQLQLQLINCRPWICCSTSKRFTDPQFAGTPPSPAPADPGFAVPAPAPGFADPGAAAPVPGPVPAPELTDFQALNYIASNSDLISAIGTDIEAAKSHYRNFGFNEGRNIDAFNASNYLEKYPDLKNVFGGDLDKALKHYIQDGFREGRNIPLNTPQFAAPP